MGFCTAAGHNGSKHGIDLGLKLGGPPVRAVDGRIKPRLEIEGIES